MLFQIKHSGACHPLMELCHHLVVHAHIPLHKALYDFSCSVSENHRFNIIPLTLNRVELIFLPKMSKYLILNGIHRSIVNQDGYWLSRNLPSSDTHLQSELRRHFLAPLGKQRRVFNKIQGLVGFFNHIRTYRNIMIIKLLL